VQLEIKRRKRYLEEHGTNSYSNNTEKNPFASKIICGECNKVFTRKGWRSSTGAMRKIWQCSERYKVKGIMGCGNRHVEESTLEKAFVMAWNGILENKEYFLRKWEAQKKSEDLLEVYRAKDFMELMQVVEKVEKINTDFAQRTLDHIKVFENGVLMVLFLDGTEIECRSEEV
jgi:site-specific DNA recombinase